MMLKNFQNFAGKRELNQRYWKKNKIRIGIIGPSKTREKELIEKVAKLVAKSGNEIVVTPDKGSASEFFAQEYLSQKGKKVYSVIPLDDKEFGYGWVNQEIGEKVNCGTWRNQPEKLNELSDALICIGWADGVLAEIAYAKWFKPKGIDRKPVYIITELAPGKLPKDSCKSDIRYIPISSLEKEIKKSIKELVQKGVSRKGLFK